MSPHTEPHHEAFPRVQQHHTLPGVQQPFTPPDSEAVKNAFEKIRHMFGQRQQEHAQGSDHQVKHNGHESHVQHPRDLEPILSERDLYEINEILAREYDEFLYEREFGEEDLFEREFSELEELD